MMKSNNDIHYSIPAARSVYVISGRDGLPPDVAQCFQRERIALVQREYQDDVGAVARKIRAADFVLVADPTLSSESEIAIAIMVFGDEGADGRIVLVGSKEPRSAIEWTPRVYVSMDDLIASLR